MVTFVTETYVTDIMFGRGHPTTLPLDQFLTLNRMVAFVLRHLVGFVPNLGIVSRFTILPRLPNADLAVPLFLSLEGIAPR